LASAFGRLKKNVFGPGKIYKKPIAIYASESWTFKTEDYLRAMVEKRRSDR